MTHEHLPDQRPKTARELAEALGVSERTITRRWAEPRAMYVQRAAERRQRVAALRKEGMTFPEIASEMEISVQAAKNLAQRAKQKGNV